MIENIDGLDIFYEREKGAEGLPILLLHGWGADSNTMKGLFNFIKSQQRDVINMDLPYFGQSSMPPEHFGVYEYADIVNKFLDRLKVKKAIVLGHSFGGRLAIILSQKYHKAEKLILIDAAGCKPRKSLKKRFKILLYKIKKRFKIKQKNAGSEDYRALPEQMKKVFVRVVNTHLEKDMKQVTVPSLLIWGKADLDTPLYMAKRMNKLISDSGLVVLENAGHYSFADRYSDVCQIINSFM